MSNLWWLSASPEELKAASTCRDCGCGDADIDLGLCYDCFCKHNQQEQKQLVRSATAKYTPSAAEVERSEIEGDRIAMFRAEY